MMLVTILYEVFLLLSFSDAYCIWTECQTKNYRVCEDYSAKSFGFQSCSGPVKYLCCSDNGIPKKEPREKVVKQAEKLDEHCAWSGCEPDIWAAKGCEVRGKVERQRFACTDGHRYYCCSPPKAEVPVKQLQDCWWTGCQLTSWAVVGCAHYDRIEINRSFCTGGIKYHCCVPSNEVIIPRHRFHFGFAKSV